MEISLNTLSSRQYALEWWNSLLCVQKWEHIVKNKSIIKNYPDTDIESLTGKEIEQMWINRNL